MFTKESRVIPVDVPVRAQIPFADPGGTGRRKPVRRPAPTAGYEQVPIGNLLPADSPRLNGEDEQHVRRLAENRDSLPPIVVDRRTMRIIDGMHRYRCAQLTGAEHLDARYFDGDPADAFVLAVSLNAKHGLPLSRQEQISAAARILRTHANLSDVALAGICGVSDKTVARLRRQQFDLGESEVEHRLGRDGRRRPAGAGAGAARIRAAEFLRRNPRASLRQVASATQLSPSTVKDVRDRIARGEPPVPGRAADPVVGRKPVLAADEVLVRACLANLQNDPQVRRNHVGRFLLQLIRSNAIDPAHWEQLADAVPGRWIQPMSEVAGMYADAWIRFSQRLAARRSPDSGFRSSV